MKQSSQTRQMRVLLMIDSLSGGGAERSTLDYCLFLMRNDHAVKLVCLRTSYPGFHEEAEKEGVDTCFLQNKHLLSQLKELDALYKTFRPHIVHATLSKSRLRARLHKLLYFRRYPLVESLVTMSFTSEKIRQRGRRYFTDLLHKVVESVLAWSSVNKFIAISDEVKEHYVKQHFGIKRKSVSVIYRGRALNPFVNQKLNLRKFYASTFSFDEDAIVLIHIGRQDFPKNHMFLLSAFFRLAVDQQNEKYVLLCVGKNGEMTEKIQALVKKESSRSKVLFLGHRVDVPQLLAQGDIFIFPSLYEGLGGAIIEAKAAGLPLVVSDLPVFRELLTENTEALFGDPSDLDDFVAKIKYLGTNPTVRNTMGSRNQESFKNKFLIDKVNQQMLDLYRSLLYENTSTGN